MHGASSLHSSLVRFASGVIGNLGAPVDLDRQFDSLDDDRDQLPRTSSNPLADGLLPISDREELSEHP